jgi:hypothetical protein
LNVGRHAQVLRSAHQTIAAERVHYETCFGKTGFDNRQLAKDRSRPLEAAVCR